MLRTLLCDESQQFRVVEDPAAISDIVQHKERLLWLDMEQPTRQEFEMLQQEFGLHPLAIEDAMARHQRPKIDQYENFYLVVFYSVACENPEESEPTSVRRGMRGSRFHGAEEDSPSVYQDSKNGHTGPQGATQEAQNTPVPVSSATAERIVLRELTMFMGENYLITVHTQPIAELEEAAKRWRQNVEVLGAEDSNTQHVPGTRALTEQERSELKVKPQEKSKLVVPDEGAPPTIKQPSPGRTGRNGRQPGDANHANDIGILLYSLLDTIVDDYFPVIDSIVDRVEDLEEQIFEHYSQEAIESIFGLKKDLLSLRKVLAPERDVLNILTRRDIPIFEQHTLVYFQDVYDHVVRITDSIDTYRDLLSSALDSFLSMQSNRLNVTVQTLTSVSIILMSVAAVTGWYGMNFQNMPELHTQYGYFVVMAVVAVMVLLELLFFKRKRWL